MPAAGSAQSRHLAQSGPGVTGVTVPAEAQALHGTPVPGPDGLRVPASDSADAAETAADSHTAHTPQAPRPQPPPPPLPSPPPAAPIEALQVAPADIRGVTTVEELCTAISEGAQDIEIREHLDLTPLLDGVTRRQGTQYDIGGQVDPMALLKVASNTRSIRVPPPR